MKESRQKLLYIKYLHFDSTSVDLRECSAPISNSSPFKLYVESILFFQSENLSQ